MTENKNIVNFDDEEELELTDRQLAQIDAVQNAVYDLCKIMSGNNNLPWSMEFIGEIADIAGDILVKCGIPVYYPAIITGKDGSEYIEAWSIPEKNSPKGGKQ